MPHQAPGSTSSSDARPLRRRVEIQATPKPDRKNRRARITDVALLRSVKRTPGLGNVAVKRVKGRGHRGRSKSMGGEGESRRARFGDDVKSPGKGLLRRVLLMERMAELMMCIELERGGPPLCPPRIPPQMSKFRLTIHQSLSDISLDTSGVQNSHLEVFLRRVASRIRTMLE